MQCVQHTIYLSSKCHFLSLVSSRPRCQCLRGHGPLTHGDAGLILALIWKITASAFYMNWHKLASQICIFWYKYCIAHLNSYINITTICNLEMLYLPITFRNIMDVGVEVLKLPGLEHMWWCLFS